MTTTKVKPTSVPPAFAGWEFEPGCYVDGARGIYAIDHVISYASHLGFVAPECDCEQCKTGGPYSSCEFAYADLADDVDAYLNARFPFDGFAWGWDSGDWGLWPIGDNVCGQTGTQEHASDCRYLGNDLWDCGKIDNNPF